IDGLPEAGDDTRRAGTSRVAGENHCVTRTNGLFRFMETPDNSTAPNTRHAYSEKVLCRSNVNRAEFVGNRIAQACRQCPVKGHQRINPVMIDTSSNKAPIATTVCPVSSDNKVKCS